MGRRASRDIAMKLLYQLEIQKEDKDEQIRDVLDEYSLLDNDRKYVTDVVEGVGSNLPYIDKIIDQYAKGWKINRISKVDLSILRLSVYEISFMDDIPFNVSVNEAVELAKKYSGEDSGSFINGILGKVTKAQAEPAEEKTEQ
jgi:transcription antitermination protein NusB